MNAFLVSTGIVALAEIGDKTQLLAFLLAAKFKRPIPIVFGILVGTVVNHTFAGAIGAWLAHLIGPDGLRWILGGAFLAMAVWVLLPDRHDDETPLGAHGVFIATALAFFSAEMGDKTQLATVALAARFPSLLAVVAGSTTGMMLANVPAVYFGDRFARKLSPRVVHIAAAVLFAALGLATLLGLGAQFGF